MEFSRHNSSQSEQSSRIFLDERNNFHNPYQSGSSSSQDLKKGKTMGVLLKVIIGKTVEAFKVSNGAFLSQGKAGVAILGNESQSRYDLYVYKEDQQKITSARITARFNFETHPHYYGTFYDNSAVSWSLRFDQESDMTEFIREVALARWRSPNGNTKILVQDVIYGDSRKVVTPENGVQMAYKISYLKQDNKFIKGVNSRQFENSANSTTWEIPVIGWALQCKKIVILPSNKLGHWKDIAPDNCHVWLEMFVKDIFQQNKLPPLQSLSCQMESVPNRIEEGEDKLSMKKESIASRLVKMGGQALVPFPGFPSEMDCRETDEEDDDDDDSVSIVEPMRQLRRASVVSDRSSSVIEDQQDDDLEERRLNEKLSFPPVVQPRLSLSTTATLAHSTSGHCYIPPMINNCSTTSSDHHHINRTTHFNQLPSSCSNVDEDVYRPNIRNVRDPEFNMLFSEMRTCNSEVRMSLMRVTDKVDALINKSEPIVDKQPINIDDKLLEKLDPLLKNMNNWLEYQDNLKISLNEKFDVIADQNQAIIEMLLQQQKLKLDGNKKLDLIHDDIINSISINQHQTAGRLKESLSEGDGLISKIVGDDIMSTSTSVCKDCKCHSTNHIAGMEACLKTLEERNASLESAKIDLDYQLIQAQENISLLKKENEQIRLLEITNKELTKRISELEKERLSRIVENESDSKSDVKLSSSPRYEDISEAVKRVINQAYKALKVKLSNPEPNQSLQEILSLTLKGVTNNFLKKHGMADSGIEASEQNDDTSKYPFDERKESDSCRGDASSSGRFSPTSSPLPPLVKPPPRPKPKPRFETQPPDTNGGGGSKANTKPLSSNYSSNRNSTNFDSSSSSLYWTCQSEQSFSNKSKDDNCRLPLDNENFNSSNSDCLDSSKSTSKLCSPLDNDDFKASLGNVDLRSSNDDDCFDLARDNYLRAGNEININITSDGNINIETKSNLLKEDKEIIMKHSLKDGENRTDRIKSESNSSSSPEIKSDENPPSPLLPSVLPNYVPFVDTDPPPIPNCHSSSPSPTDVADTSSADPSVKQGETYSVITSKSDISKSSKYNEDEDWRPQPPPLHYGDDEDEDAWLFYS